MRSKVIRDLYGGRLVKNTIKLHCTIIFAFTVAGFTKYKHWFDDNKSLSLFIKLKSYYTAD